VIRQFTSTPSSSCGGSSTYVKPAQSKAVHSPVQSKEKELQKQGALQISPTVKPTYNPGSNVDPHNSLTPLRVLLMVKRGTSYYVSQIRTESLTTVIFFQKLKLDYIRLRGLPRRLFSVWRFSHCDFYRVRSAFFLLIISNQRYSAKSSTFNLMLQ
jgi:hypothetical protein